MKVIIAGAGRVGYHLSKLLSKKHDVIMIDENKEALDRLQDEIDLLPIMGNIKNPSTYLALNMKHADLFLAVTSVDDSNMLASLVIDDYIKVDKKLVRLNKSDFFAQGTITSRLNIFRAIYPARLLSAEVQSILKFPKAYSVKDIPDTSLHLVSIKSMRDDLTYLDILKNNSNTILVAIEREDRLISINLQEPILKNDLIYLFGEDKQIEAISDILSPHAQKNLDNFIVFGAEEVGIEVAKTLIRAKKKVKVLEKNTNMAKKASIELGDKAIVINSKYGKEHFFSHEGLQNANVFISTIRNDEFNIIKCLEAREAGIEKVIAINNELEYYALMHKLGIANFQGLKTSTFYAIFEGIESTDVVSSMKFGGVKGTIFFRKAMQTLTIDKNRLKFLHKRPAFLVAVRHNKILRIENEFIVQAEDLLLLFSLDKTNDGLLTWLSEL